MVGWAASSLSTLLVPEGRRRGLWSCPGGWLGSFLSHACSSHQAFNLDLDPTAPAARVPPAMALSELPTPVLLHPRSPQHIEAGLSPGLGGCEPDQGAWGFSSVPRAGSWEPTLGVGTGGGGTSVLTPGLGAGSPSQRARDFSFCGPLLGVSASGWASPPALQSSCHTCQEPECQCFLLPGLGLGPLALFRDPRGESTVSHESHHFSGCQWLALAALGQGLSVKLRWPRALAALQ